MDMKLEIFASVVSDAVKNAIEYIDINTDEVVNSSALVVLEEIKSVIVDEKIEDDFDMVEQIVKVLERYNIDTGFRHDF